MQLDEPEDGTDGGGGSRGVDAVRLISAVLADSPSNRQAMLQMAGLHLALAESCYLTHSIVCACLQLGRLSQIQCMTDITLPYCTAPYLRLCRPTQVLCLQST